MFKHVEFVFSNQKEVTFFVEDVAALRLPYRILGVEAIDGVCVPKAKILEAGGAGAADGAAPCDARRELLRKPTSAFPNASTCAACVVVAVVLVVIADSGASPNNRPETFLNLPSSINLRLSLNGLLDTPSPPSGAVCCVSTTGSFVLNAVEAVEAGGFPPC